MLTHILSMRFGVFLKPVSYLLILILTSSCTTLKPMQSEMSIAQIVQQLNPGEQISIETKTHEKFLITIESISDGEIVGSGRVFQVDEIVEIRRKKLDLSKTTGALVGGATVLIWLLVFLIIGAAGG